MNAPDARIEREAARWLARRDRGLSSHEEAEFRSWQAAAPAHAEAVRRLGSAWARLDSLRGLAEDPVWAANPELLSPPPARRAAGAGAWAALAAAAALALSLGIWSWRDAGRASAAAAPAPRLAIVADGQRHPLPDGSVADLNRGSEIDVRFTPGERRIELLRGEANFTVTKNPSRPFLVSAGGVVVRAVGTVFSVHIQPDSVEVLVTEGKVRVARGSDMPGTFDGPDAPPLVAAGQRAIFRRGVPVANVQTLSHDDIERILAWENPRLVFSGQSLAAVAEQFNRYNRSQLVIADPETARIAVGGSFRANHVNAFVRLLTSSFGIDAEQQGDRILLRKRHPDTR